MSPYHEAVDAADKRVVGNVGARLREVRRRPAVEAPELEHLDSGEAAQADGLRSIEQFRQPVPARAALFGETKLLSRMIAQERVQTDGTSEENEVFTPEVYSHQQRSGKLDTSYRRC